jgi:predicted transposase YbfD/YdcC
LSLDTGQLKRPFSSRFAATQSAVPVKVPDSRENRCLVAYKSVRLHLVASFEKIKDPRHGGNTLHHFGEIIFVAYTCLLCGVKSYELMQEFCEIRPIENSCHWVLNTLFRKDHNQTRQKNGAKNHSTMRRIAHNTLKRAPDHSKRKRPGSLSKKQLRAAQYETYLELLLSLV